MAKCTGICVKKKMWKKRGKVPPVRTNGRPLGTKNGVVGCLNVKIALKWYDIALKIWVPLKKMYDYTIEFIEVVMYNTGID